MGQNYFQLLNSTPASTPEEITAAFRELSRKMHPDVSDDSEAYADIVGAYGVLKDDKTRHAYIQWLELTQARCPICKGLGVVWKQQGFRGGTFTRCASCKGGGFYEPGK